MHLSYSALWWALPFLLHIWSHANTHRIKQAFSALINLYMYYIWMVHFPPRICRMISFFSLKLEQTIRFNGHFVFLSLFDFSIVIIAMNLITFLYLNSIGTFIEQYRHTKPSAESSYKKSLEALNFWANLICYKSISFKKNRKWLLCVGGLN